MSLQNISPYYMQQLPYGYSQTPIQANQYNRYVYNPYSASFYNQNIIYPYQPIQGKEYTKIGELVAPNGEITHLFQLSNGHQIAIMQRKDAQSIVKTFVDAGSMNETDEKRGVSHVNEHGLFKGSTKFKDGDVFKLTGQMGAYTNASTDYAQINYYISAPYMGLDELKKTIELQGDMIYNPLFDKDSMESEKGPICSEISMISDNISTVAFDKVIRNLFQIQSNSENLVAGSIETVQALNKTDMHNYHQTYYTPQNLHTVIIADESIPLETIIEQSAKSFKAAYSHNQKIQEKKEELNPLQVAKREDMVSGKTNSTEIYIGFAGPISTNSKDFVIQSMIDYYINQCSTSDLKKNLEGMDANYSSTMQKVGLKETDPYAMVNLISTNPNEEQKALDYFYDAIIKLQTESLSDDDMQAIRNYLEKNLEYQICDSEALCDTIGNCLRDNSIDYFTNYKNIISSITKEDIKNFAKRYYDLNKVSIVVVHPTCVSKNDIINNYQNSKYSAHNVQKAKKISFTGMKNVHTDDVKEYQLSNNTHLILNKTNSNLCVFNWCVNTPPIKPKNPNIPAVLRYMFTKGSQYHNQDELERYKELNGIDLDVFTNGRSIEITGDCLAKDTEKTLALMNELMYHPKLTQEDFNAAKKYVKSMLQQSQKNANENLLDKLYPEFFPTNRKKLKEIDKLELSDIKEFYYELLKNASSTFSATLSENDYQQLEKDVIAHQNMPNVIFKESIQKLAPIFEANPQPNVIIDSDDFNQAQIYQSYKFPMSGNVEDEAKFELVHTILGGSSNARLFSDLREKQNLAYAVSSRIQSFANTGILTMQIQTTTDDKEANVQSFDNVKKSLEGFKKHRDLLCSELVSDEELASAKMQLKQKIIGQCQNPHTENDLLAMNALEPYGIKRIDKYVEAIDKITKEDIKQAANFIFSFNPTTSVLASQDTINSQIDYLKTLGTIETT